MRQGFIHVDAEPAMADGDCNGLAPAQKETPAACRRFSLDQPVTINSDD
jgi:hypothetical protein